ncbi:hypothetical protein Tco_0537982 [Tanacetum coccineum]
MFEMTKTKVIKVVQEEAKNITLDPKTIISAKAGEKFKKAQDAEHQVLKREHSQKAKRAMKLRKKRNFQVHNLFKFVDFGVTKLDELGLIIQKKKNTISALPAHVLEQAPSESLGRKRKHMELEPKIKMEWYSQSWSGFSCVIPSNGLNDQDPRECQFSLKLRKLIVEHPDQEKLKSKKMNWGIIEKKKNKIVVEFVISLGKRHERLKKIPKELRIQSALPAPALSLALELKLAGDGVRINLDGVIFNEKELGSS